MNRIWLVWDGMYDERHIAAVHASEAGAMATVRELIAKHERRRGREWDGTWREGPWRPEDDVRHSSGGVTWWATNSWSVELESEDVQP